MKSVGIVRKIDELGRIVIPKETRHLLDMQNGDSLEILTDKDTIYLKKYNPGCIFCGELSDTEIYRSLHICQKCKEELIQKFKNVQE